MTDEEIAALYEKVKSGEVVSGPDFAIARAGHFRECLGMDITKDVEDDTLIIVFPGGKWKIAEAVN